MESVSEGGRQRVRKGSHASSSSVRMIFVTPGLWKSASPRLYVGLNWDLGKKKKWLPSNAVSSHFLQRELICGRLYLGDLYSTADLWASSLPVYRIIKPQRQSFSIFRQEHKGRPCKRAEAPQKYGHPVLWEARFKHYRFFKWSRWPAFCERWKSIERVDETTCSHMLRRERWWGGLFVCYKNWCSFSG